ncbi:DnaJ domain containing protein [Trichomonas vaginalis G3]|uniref:DnaJ domain containing protein n=1 Tax=Trichomonas vaginalis (strain ATCC PRA-98 / G3) TaxID=412133 RepID=A2DN65_TRIV3|nr:heat shock protein binding [Trichomonas vaginalis G3]EAY18053.1 DnaJ domain containing protein [Trichomonas vaginalis G3]KAI5492318.1 heat shock protein binding [Trichomonas vaginalis G3]|eukprot:XP_001579039.1 DnaJ domain containing protein [Trichomonas vaginalis G3]
MVVDTHLYDLLGVKPDANERELKKAFMIKARELHPDKNRDDPQATEKFQAVNEAYEILKDPQKRETYDRYGPDGLKEGMGGNAEDIFSHLFGDFGGFGFGGGRRQQRRQRTQDVLYDIKCTLEDLYNGKETTLKINRQVICPKCHGTGCLEGKSSTTCKDCQGRGQRVQVVRMGPVITQQVTTCTTCNGKGQMIAAADRCKACHGSKVSQEEKKVVVHVERGMEDGDRIVLQGNADEAPDCDTGDLIVTVKEKKHDTFIRKHDDLLIKKKITLTEALLGTKFIITHLDGHKLVVSTNTNEVITPGQIKVIEREGMPCRGNAYERGRLFIAFEVEFPKAATLTSPLREALMKYLPAPDETKGFKPDENTFTVNLKDASMKDFENAKRSSSGRSREAYDSREDDDDRYGRQQASCQPM